MRTHGVVKAALFDYSPLYVEDILENWGMIQLKKKKILLGREHSTVTQQISFIKHHQDTASLKTIK